MNYFKLFLFSFRPFRSFRLTAGLVCLLWLGALAARATDRYVSPYGTNDYAGGYTNWAGAATNIQDAVSKTTTGDKVWVTNGVYYFSTIVTNSFSDYAYASGARINTALVMITNGITVQSMNGPTYTIIDGLIEGSSVSFASRCVFLAYNSSLKGFTVRNGRYNSEHWMVLAGAGVRIHDGGAISNCIITTNKTSHGGGVAITSSSIGSVYNCVISNNEATAIAGGLYIYDPNGIARDSIICDNMAASDCGGIFINAAGFVVSNCVVTRNNLAGIEIYTSGKVVNCQIVSNTGTKGYFWYGNGDSTATLLNSIISYNTGYGMYFGVNNVKATGIVRNCLISGNSDNGIYVDSTISNNYATIDSCTIVKNNKGIVCQSGGKTNPFTASNCIIYSNAPADIVFANAANTIFYNSCATNNLPATQGNVNNNPQFVDLANGNYRLRANSPCVNTGTNQSWMTNAVDLGGRARIRYGTVDMGAYEVIYNGTIFKF